MKLKDVIKNVAQIQTRGNLDIEITNITSDSREVKPNGLFFAIKGFSLDGTKFIKSAIKNGATAIVIDDTTNISELSIPLNVPIIIVHDIRYALGIFSCNLYDNPSKKIKVIGVTGTKGKTTSTYMIKSILENAGHKVGLIGSIAIYIGDKKIEDCERTSSESYKLFKTLDTMVKENVEIAIVEVSSQAMKLNRVTGCKFDAVLFTNLSEDHISPKEHANMEEYFNAKLSLAKMAPIIVTNLDNSYTQQLPKLLPDKKVITFSLKNNNANIFAENLKPSNSYVDFTISMNKQVTNIHLSIPGEYMVYNALGAIGISNLFGATEQDFKNGLSNFKVFGRSEVVPNKLGLTIIIDYAHTPSSLESILKTVKPYTKGRVICTWGVGGDRDKAKRPIMGEISGTLADYTILTTDQARTEDPRDIIADIEVGIKKVSGNYTVIVNRTEAIRHAITMANKDDTIVIPGLGSDLYMEYMGVKYPYNERTIISEIIDELIETGQ